jgi:tRNA(fMet)-specific endonuclease VapC
MLQYLLDTDHLTHYERGQPLFLQRFAAQPPDTVGVSVVTIEESLRGWLAFLARARDGAARINGYGYLLTVFNLLCGLPRVPFDQASEDQFQQLLALKLRISTQDLKIAAVALANNLTLLTCNRRDFGRVPGLVLEDWSV